MNSKSKIPGSYQLQFLSSVHSMSFSVTLFSDIRHAGWGILIEKRKDIQKKKKCMKKNLLVLKSGEREIYLSDNHRIICNILNS